MKKSYPKVDKRSKSAITDIIGTLILLMIAVSLFSVLYYFVFSIEAPGRSPSVSIIGYVDGNDVTLEHWGGESLTLDTKIILTIAGEVKGPYNIDDAIFHLFNKYGSDGSIDNLWSVGEKLVYNATEAGIDLINKKIDFSLIDQKSNLETARGKIQDGIISTSGNNPPDQPSVIYPVDGGTISNDFNPTLQVRVTDSDGDSMHVSFYNFPDNSLIGTAFNVANDSIASIVWSGLSIDTYSWYVNVTDGIASHVQSAIWSFNIIDLDPPTIMITYPNGGETLQAGTTEDITWNTTAGDGNITSIDLEYSNNSGTSWTIISATSDDGIFEWTIPDVHSTNCLIRGTVHDDNSLSGIDTSNGEFTIEGIPPQSPGVPTVETSLGAIIIQDKANSMSLIQGDEGSTGYVDTYSSDDIYHTIKEINTVSSKYSLEAIYSVTISAGTNSPYTLYIESYTNDSAENYPISYAINGGGYTTLGNMGTSEAIQFWILPGVSENDIITIKIEDFEDTSHEPIGAVFIDHLYIESIQGAGTSDNLVNWTRSGDDGIGLKDVDYYNVYRSEFLGSLWDTPYDTVNADGVTLEYSYTDTSAGDGDGKYWYYGIRAVDEDGLDDGNTNSGQET